MVIGMQYSRKMGIDYGDKRIGIAFTDLLCVLANPYEVYKNVDEEQTLQHIKDLAKEMQVSEIILGLPLNMDGTEGERTCVTKQFGNKLAEFTNLPIIYVDERLSSYEAEEMLKDQGVKSWEKRKEMLDMVSAQVILQTYLNAKK